MTKQSLIFSMCKLLVISRVCLKNFGLSFKLKTAAEGYHVCKLPTISISSITVHSSTCAANPSKLLLCFGRLVV